MNKKLAELIATWMEAFAGPDGYELSRCEYVKEGQEKYLRVYVDKLAGGEYVSMSTDDCETVSRFLSDKLDDYDPIKEAYFLEVSSPGLDRELVSDKDFERFRGSLVDVRLYKALDGKKLYTGILKGYADGIITIEDGGKDLSIEKEKVSKIQLAVVF